MLYHNLPSNSPADVAEDYNADEKYVVLIAAFLNNVRLIDNLEVAG